MQPIHHAVKASQNALNAAAARPTSETPELPTAGPSPQAMRTFWARMAAIYGHKWSSAYGELPEDDNGKATTAGDTWRRGLMGIPSAALGIGLNACVVSADPWPPTLPEFRAMCLAVPSLAAVRMAIRHGGAEPFIRLVYQYLDTFAHRHADVPRAEKMLADAYQQAREHVMQGKPLPPEPVAAIESAREHAPVNPAHPETVREAVERARAVLDGEAA